PPWELADPSPTVAGSRKRTLMPGWGGGTSPNQNPLVFLLYRQAFSPSRGPAVMLVNGRWRPLTTLHALPNGRKMVGFLFHWWQNSATIVPVPEWPGFGE